MDQKKKNERVMNKEDQIADDEATIFAETAHIRDRDEIVLDGNHTVQGGSSTDIGNEWDPADGDRLIGASDQSSEPVDSQLHQIGRITQDIRESQDHRQPTVAKPIDDADNYEELSDDELMKYADVLGIPDRHEVPRMALIEKIRAESRAGL